MTGPARNAASLPAGYGELVKQIKTEVRTARLRGPLGQHRADRPVLAGGPADPGPTERRGLGARVVERLVGDLRAEFPAMRGLSRRNLFYRRGFAAAYGEEIVQQPVALPPGHVTVLLDKLDDQAERDWYAAAAVQHGWSRDVLAHQITTRLHTRAGGAPSNFGARLPRSSSATAKARAVQLGHRAVPAAGAGPFAAGRTDAVSFSD